MKDNLVFLRAMGMIYGILMVCCIAFHSTAGVLAFLTMSVVSYSCSFVIEEIRNARV